MQFTITISGEGPELSNALQTLRTVMDGHTITNGEVSATVVPSDKQKRTKKDQPAQEVVEEPPLGDQPPEEVDEQELDIMTDDPIPTTVELRAAAQMASKKAGKEAVKALLDEYGSNSISDVPEDKRAAFIKALEALKAL